MIRVGLADLDKGTPVETLIVGSGPAGLTLALELARLGRPSLVMESGLREPGPAQDLSAATIVDPRRHDDMAIAVARRYGGTSNLWGGRCVPLDPIDFEPRSYAAGARWPIAFADLAPWYETACRYATCGDAVFSASPSLPGADPSFACDRLERASNVPRFQVAHRAVLESKSLIDLRLGASVVDIALDEASRTTHVDAIDVDGARIAIAARRVVLAAGGLESTRLLLAVRKSHEGLFGGRDGPLGRYYMGHWIGEIADVTFATDAADSAFDFFQDGRGSFVRRRMTPSESTQHALGLPNACFWPVVPPVADPRHGSGALSAVALALATPWLGRRLIPEAIRARHIHGEIDALAHLGNVARDGPATARFLSRFVVQRYLSRERVHGYFLRNPSRRYGLSFSAEQSPRAESRVRLSTATDRLGLPRLAIDLRFARDDAEALVSAHRALGDWLACSGLGRLDFRHTDPVEAVLERAGHGTHQIGTARMGEDRIGAVVDRNLRCFDVPNLHVLGSAVFPTSGQANPTLSIVAFAARLADHLARETARSALP